MNKGLRGAVRIDGYGYKKGNDSTNKFYFQLFETPINYDLIRKLSLGLQSLALRGRYCYILEILN